MRLLSNVIDGVRSLFRKRAIESEMDEELRGFVEASTADKLHRGMTPDEAIRAAREEFGVELAGLDFEILTPGSRGVLGMGADVTKARGWYEKAKEYGSREAPHRLELLANR